ncbi:MAG TPA: phosphotransferase [Halanaerobiales bacterium]|nr:phosphotransferase [Halanaerobiales bacterium]
MLLEDEFLKKYRIKDYQIIREFKSKKNRVFLIKSTVINEQDTKDSWLNCFILKEKDNDLRKELDFLKRLRKKDLKVPRLIYRGNKHLILEYIPGPTLLDCVCRLEEKQAGYQELKRLFRGLLYWLRDFYQLEAGTILGDINFRNFIITEEKIVYGLDFEDCRKGPVEEDIGRFIAFGLSYRPEFSDWKLKTYSYLLRYFIQQLDLSPASVEHFYCEELYAIEERRGIDISKGLGVM